MNFIFSALKMFPPPGRTHHRAKRGKVTVSRGRARSDLQRCLLPDRVVHYNAFALDGPATATRVFGTEA